MSCSGSPRKAASAELDTDKRTFPLMVPSTMASFVANRVRDCGTFQFDGVNTRLDTLDVHCCGLELFTAIVTLFSGACDSDTEIVSAAPPSVSTTPVTPAVRILGTSSFTLKTGITMLGRASNSFVVVAASLTNTVITTYSAPSMRSSSIAFRVTACGTFQLAVVNISVVLSICTTPFTDKATSSVTFPGLSNTN